MSLPGVKQMYKFCFWGFCLLWQIKLNDKMSWARTEWLWKTKFPIGTQGKIRFHTNNFSLWHLKVGRKQTDVHCFSSLQNSLDDTNLQLPRSQCHRLLHSHIDLFNSFNRWLHFFFRVLFVFLIVFINLVSVQSTLSHILFLVFS